MSSCTGVPRRLASAKKAKEDGTGWEAASGKATNQPLSLLGPGILAQIWRNCNNFIPEGLRHGIGACIRWLTCAILALATSIPTPEVGPLLEAGGGGFTPCTPSTHLLYILHGVTWRLPMSDGEFITAFADEGKLCP